jgi:hypothetical protein
VRLGGAPRGKGTRERSSRRRGSRPPGLHSRKIPAFEDRCIPAGFVARPHRTASGTPRSCASPFGAHRPSRCTASSGTEPLRPGGAFRGGRASADVQVHRTSSDGAKTPSEAAERVARPFPGTGFAGAPGRSNPFAHVNKATFLSTARTEADSPIRLPSPADSLLTSGNWGRPFGPGAPDGTPPAIFFAVTYLLFPGRTL